MNLFKTLQNIRRTIHQNPELSNKEFKTADLVEKILKEQVASTNVKTKSDKSKNSVSCMKQTHNIGVMNRGLKQCMHG